ncbi:MAG: prolyl oligopeptidase family serine peptidase [Bacteroidota bacterium]
MKKCLLYSTLVGMIVLFVISTNAQTKFTPADAIDVVSLRNVNISPDGKYVLAIKNQSYLNRFDVDHFRFRDPSYVRPFSGDLVIYNTSDKTETSILGEAAHVSNPRWSFSGKKLAFFKLEDGKYQLYTYEVSSKKLKKIPTQSDRIMMNGILDWAGDDQSIVIGMRADDWMEKGMEMYEEANNGPITVYDSEEPFLKWDALGVHSSQFILTQVNLADGAIDELLPEGDISAFYLDEKQEFLTYLITEDIKTSYDRKDGSEYEWRKLDLTNRSDTTIIKEKSSKRQSYRFSDDFRWIAWSDSGHVFVQSLVEGEPINLTKDKNRLSDEDSTEVKFSVTRWNADATKLIANSKQGMWVIDREEGTLKRFVEYDEDAKNPPRLNVMSWHPNDRYLYISYSAGDKWDRGMLRYDFQAESMDTLVKNQDLYRSWSISKDRSRIAYMRSDGNRPDDLYVVDADFKSPKRFTNLNPWLKDKKFTKTELISYLDTDGKELNGILYYPVDYEPGKKYPLVCEIYERFFDNGYRPSMNIIANEGYFGFRPSVNLEQGRPGVAWIKGVTAGINKLIEEGKVDPEKIGVHGTSYGGYAASLLIAQTNRFAAAINISGKTNMISFLGDSPKIGTRNYAAAEVGQDRIGESLWEAPMKYIEHSAIMYADKMNTPHLLLTGEGDWNVPAANTRELYYALRRLGKKVVWVNYKNAGHGAGWAGSRETYDDQWERMLAWYEEHFKDKEEEKKP